MITYGFSVYLTELSSLHLEQMRQWRNLPEIIRWCRQNKLIVEADQINWFEKINRDPTIRMFAVKNYDGEYGDKLVGVCGLTDIDFFNGRSEFSLYVGPEHQKMAYGKSALQTLLSHGFHDLGLNVIWGETFENNPAQKLFESLCMVKEGSRRLFYFKEGRLWDAHLYSMTNEEFYNAPWNIACKVS